MCFLPEATVNASELYSHRGTCAAPSSATIHPIHMVGLTVTGVPVRLVSGGMSDALRGTLEQYCESVETTYTDSGGHLGCQPWFGGKVFTIGWQQRGVWAGPAGCSERLARRTKEIMELTMAEPTVQLARDCIGRLPEAGRLPMPDANGLRVGGPTQCMVGNDFMPAIPLHSDGAPPHHPPMGLKTFGPPQVGCHAHCLTCSRDGCIYCKHCVLNCHLGNATLTVLLMYQPKRTPKGQATKFITDTTSWEINDGAIFVFDAKQLPHGPWVQWANPSRFPCLSVSFVGL